MADESLCCETCKKTQAEAPNLKVCAKCKGTRYCSRDCQKADWKTHKKVCAKNAQNASTNTTSQLKNVEQQIPNPFTRLDNNTYLHDRPEKDVYKLLIDSFRMRQADNRNVDGVVDSDGIYGGAPTSLPGFRRFLELAKQRSLLPSWWNDEKGKECEEFGSDTSTWSSLARGVEKHDIIQHYGNNTMPMQLRMLAEVAYNRGPGGQDGTGMRRAMMGMEADGGEGGQIMSMLSL